MDLLVRPERNAHKRVTWRKWRLSAGVVADRAVGNDEEEDEGGGGDLEGDDFG